jgi:hypothetical protein
MSVVTVYRGIERNNGKLVKVKRTDKLDVPKLIKSAALKFGIKKRVQQFVLVDAGGVAVGAQSIITDRCELFLCRADEKRPSVETSMEDLNDVDDYSVLLPADMWSLVISFLAPSRELLRCTCVSLVFHREIPRLFGKGVLTEDLENINDHVGFGERKQHHSLF